jgi:hypothetical protein
MSDTTMFRKWMDGGSVEKIGDDTYIEQGTLWRKKFTMLGLIEFYTKEFE